MRNYKFRMLTHSSNKICASKRLVHIHRPEGRILSHPYLSPTQKISPICLPGHNIRVYGAPIRPFIESTGVCKMHRSGHCPTKREGNALSDIHRRLAFSLTVSRTNSGSHQTAHVTSGHPGFHGELGKECFVPNSHSSHSSVCLWTRSHSERVCLWRGWKPFGLV